jgi:hypothetical protein
VFYINLLSLKNVDTKKDAINHCHPLYCGLIVVIITIVEAVAIREVAKIPVAVGKSTIWANILHLPTNLEVGG